MEQSIARFEKRLEDANDALGTLGKHLGRGAQGSYKEVTAALRALRRDVVKTNKQALKDFDKLRTALAASTGSGRATRSSSTNSARSGTRASSPRASGSRSTGSSRSTSSRSTSSRSTSSRSGSSRSTSSRSRAKKS